MQTGSTDCYYNGYMYMIVQQLIMLDFFHMQEQEQILMVI